MIKRGNHPWLGKWALPGGFVNADETLEQAAERELAEETGIAPGQVLLSQIHTFSDPQRDPRTRVITCLFMACVDKRVLLGEPEDSQHASDCKQKSRLSAGDDAADLMLCPIEDIFTLELAGDHDQLISYALAALS
jgi:ADP-ribose pyrophosphatase YjhB (NUDIX family)